MSGLSHISDDGEARMVDVSRKSATARVAIAEGIVRMRAETRVQITEDQVAKGSVLEVARIAGIQAAKRTGEMIPLCHPLPLDGVRVDFQWLDESEPAEARLRIEAEAKVTAKTGVEMEALSAVAVAALTIYDMVKAVDKGLVIEVVRLLEKRGGKSGDYHA